MLRTARISDTPAASAAKVDRVVSVHRASAVPDAAAAETAAGAIALFETFLLAFPVVVSHCKASEWLFYKEE